MSMCYKNAIMYFHNTMIKLKNVKLFEELLNVIINIFKFSDYDFKFFKILPL